MDQADTTIVGRLVRDPVLRGEEQSRRALFTVAVNRGRDEKKKSTFIDCIAWGKRADLFQGLSKGTTLLVTGYLETDKYTKKEEDGTEKQFSKLQCNVNTMLVGAPRGARSNASESQSEGAGETVDVGAGEGDIPF